jgi:Flp pilus assembly protein CpaB
MRRALPRIRLPLPGRALELLARARVGSARRPWIRWALVAASALAVGAVVQGHASALDQARQAWGERRSVLVTRHPVARGQTIGADDVRAVQLPAASLPEVALAVLPAAAIAVDALAEGEVVSATHVRRRGSGDLPPGSSGVAVPVAEGGLQLVAGQLVDVVRAGDPLAAGDIANADAATVLARRALVVEVSATAVVVAVATASAPTAAAAAARGAVVLILSEM